MSPRWMLRAAATPERFLARGAFARVVSEARAPSKKRAKAKSVASPALLPVDLAQFLDAFGTGAFGTRAFGDIVVRASSGGARELTLLAAAAKRNVAARTRLTALLSGAVPFAETRDGDVLVYFLEDRPARGLVVALASRRGGKLEPRLVSRGVAELAVTSTMQVFGELEQLSLPASFGIAESEVVRSLLERGRERASALLDGDARVRTAARTLARRPLDVPLPLLARPPVKGKAPKKTATERTTPLSFGALVEAFVRAEDAELAARLAEHAPSADPLVARTAVLLQKALAGGKSAVLRDLARRRRVALRALAPRRSEGEAEAGTEPEPSTRTATTEAILAHFDALPPNAESYAATHEREETLLALAELGHHDAAPDLLGRALTGDAGAVEMLGALGDRSLVPLVVPEGVPHALEPGLLRGEPSRVRLFEGAVVRMLVRSERGERDQGAARAALRKLLADNPMRNWREGLERGALVREIVVALGKLEDLPSASELVAILESTSQEYRPILSSAAQALGQLRHVAALPGLERLLFSPKDAISCEAVWAVGAIGEANPAERERTAALLDRLKGLEPGAEAIRLTALAKVRPPGAPIATAEIRHALDRALWEPAYRQEDTSRRRAWALGALEELASPSIAGHEAGGFFLGHEAVRYFVTRDDHRVRRAAEAAFAAWRLPLPQIRRYYAVVVPQIEAAGGVDALFEAVRDPLGIFRHNVATRLAALGDVRAVRPLAEATARLFAEPATSTYEYDDVPPHLVAFVRALSRLNSPEGNDVLIEGLRSDNHQVRAVVAENAPDDERFVPELMAMLGDPRSFLRSRAERSLTSLGAIRSPEAAPTTNEVAIIPPGGLPEEARIQSVRRGLTR